MLTSAIKGTLVLCTNVTIARDWVTRLQLESVSIRAVRVSKGQFIGLMTHGSTTLHIAKLFYHMLLSPF